MGRTASTRGPLGRIVFGTKLKQFVQLSAVEPHSPTVGAVVDLNALPVCHEQGRLRAHGTLHLRPFRLGQVTLTADGGREGL